VAQLQSPVAGQVDVDYLDVRIAPAHVVLAGERAAHFAIATLVMDGRHFHLFLVMVVAQLEQAEFPDQVRREY
jgi:hypothetical protein